jgi:hypothetical protein
LNIPGSFCGAINLIIKYKQAWFSPVFASILKDPAERIALTVFSFLQVGLHMLGLPVWSCPIKAFLGIPCPGCGLTLAMDELLHGHVLASLQTHVFAPVFLVVFLILTTSIVLPEKQRGNLVATMASLETRTGLTAWVLSALMLYWSIRLFGLV